MQISPNSSIDSVRVISRPPAESASLPGSDSTAFEKITKLDSALQKAPLMRNDVVARGRQLAADANYPPLETIQRIGALLATHLQNAAESASSREP